MSAPVAPPLGSRRTRVRARLTPTGDALVEGAVGGRRAAAVVVLGALAMVASAPGQSFWLSLFVDDMIAGTGLTRTGFSSVYAGATLVSATVVLGVGAAFDRHGPARTWAAVALALAGASLLMSVAAGALVALVALGALRAFGQGSFPLLGTLLVARTFAGWRGRALAVAHLGSVAAAAVLPLVAAVLLDAFDWRTVLRLTALAIVVGVLPVALLVRYATQGTAPAARPVAPGRPAARLVARARRFPWRDGGGVLLVVLSVAPAISTAAVFHATSLLGASGIGRTGAAVALSVMAIAGAFGAAVGGTIVDRLGVRANLVVMNALLAVAMALLLVPGVVAAVVAFAVLGAGGGANATGAGAAWASAFGVTRLGELQSVGESARITAAALGPLPLAVAYGATGSYAVGLAALLALAAAAALLALRWRTAGGAGPPG